MQTDLYGNVPLIVIDIHETKGKRKNAVKHLMSMLEKEDIKYAIQKIPIGDVLGMNGVAIERKTVSDLVNTLKGSATGVPRFQKQMDALVEYEKPFLLIEDILAIRRDPSKGCIYIPFKSNKTKGKPFYVTMERVSFIHPSSLLGLIDSVKDRGIKILKGFNALHSAGLLYGVLTEGDILDNEKTQRLPVVRTRKGLDTIDDEQEFFMAGFPSVNVVRAKSLLEHFGNPAQAISRIDEWTDVHGVGKKTLNSAKELLFAEYGSDSDNGEEIE
ncbi:hypothetical protein EU537_04590 [Candidatus Thorarchaeota archaeon]|nr:MAG: hypothetical protein EU537_04590 [Candidatus Thorarchaeota archaeon]